MKISVVVLSKNFGKYLEKTINAILSQEYYDFEVIVIDGGSSDDSVDILKKYGESIQWVSEPDKGHGEGMYKGIQLSTGDIITFQSADDLLYPNALKMVAEYYIDHPNIVGLYGLTKNIGSNGEYVSNGYFIKKHSKRNFKYNYSKLITRKIVLPTNAVFVNMHYLKKCNYKDVIDLDVCPDYRIWLELGSYGNFHPINTLLCKNRKQIGGANINPGNIVRLMESRIKTKEWFFNNNDIPPGFRSKWKRKALNLRIRLMLPNVWLNKSSTKALQEYIKILKSDMLVLFFWPRISARVVLSYLFNKKGFN